MGVITSFEKPLHLEYIDGIHFKLEKGFFYKTFIPKGAKKLGGLVITIPDGFITDFATIPRGFWGFFYPMDKRWAKAAIIHDFIYSRVLFDRKTCDKIFKEAMIKTGTPKWNANLFYYSVRAFGWRYYNSKKRKDRLKALEESKKSKLAKSL